MDEQVFDVLFGVENEIAVAAFDRCGQRVPENVAARRTFDRVKDLLPHLSGNEMRGIFTGNGGRIYLDRDKVEVCTPEVAHPDDLCRYVRAGERTVWRAIQDLLADGTFGEATVSRCKVSYAGSSSHGFHENYSSTAPTELVTSELQGHLVSRTVFSGAGGIECDRPGPSFTLSPRVSFLIPRGGPIGCRARSFIHSDRCRLGDRPRLHLVLGEALSSDRALWLLVATTALVIAAIAAGARPTRIVQLADSAAAMHTIVGDPELRATVTATNGRHYTALELQRTHLQLVADRVGDPRMPSWTEPACRCWSDLLEQLETGPDAAAGSVDWAAKLQLFRRQAARRGLAWESLATLNPALEFVESAWRETSRISGPMPRRALAPLSLVMSRVRRPLRELRVGVKQLRQAHALRDDLCELDVRFGDLSEAGLFNVLDRAGVVDGRLFSAEEIERAMYEPPHAPGRASLRGHAIQRYARQTLRYHAHWDSIHDRWTGRHLDLSNEFDTVEHWREPTDEAANRPRTRRAVLRDRGLSLETITRYYNRGIFREAYRCLLTLRARDAPMDRRLSVRLESWLSARQGLSNGVSLLAQLADQNPAPLWLVNDYLLVHRFSRLRADIVEMTPWIRRGEQLLSQSSRQRNPAQSAAFREHHLAFLFASGRLDEAHAGLTLFFQQPPDVPPRILGRAMAMMGTVSHRLGQTGPASRWLRDAEQLQRRHGGSADLLEFTRPWLALLEHDDALACNLLEPTGDENSGVGNRVGEMRSIVLLARRTSNQRLERAIRDRIEVRLRQSPTLASCQLMQHIIARWNEWTHDQETPDANGDVYWGV